MAANIVYLVKKQHFDLVDVGTNIDETIAVCSTLEKAVEYIDKPNFDMIITKYEVDNPDNEELVVNLDPFYRRA